MAPSPPQPYSASPSNRASSCVASRQRVETIAGRLDAFDAERRSRAAEAKRRGELTTIGRYVAP
jgi:hypothetical protein